MHILSVYIVQAMAEYIYADSTVEYTHSFASYSGVYSIIHVRRTCTLYDSVINNALL